MCDSEHRLHLSVWLRDGINVDTDGWKFRVEGRDTVAGFLPGAPWRTDFNGCAHHVGLLLHPEVLRRLAGEQGEAFFECLRRDGYLRVRPADVVVLRAARELDIALLASNSSPLLREAKSLELLARLVEAGVRQNTVRARPRERERLEHARDLLLADLVRAPTIAELARAWRAEHLPAQAGLQTAFWCAGLCALPAGTHARRVGTDRLRAHECVGSRPSPGLYQHESFRHRIPQGTRHAAGRTQASIIREQFSRALIAAGPRRPGGRNPPKMGVPGIAFVRRALSKSPQVPPVSRSRARNWVYRTRRHSRRIAEQIWSG